MSYRLFKLGASAIIGSVFTMAVSTADIITLVLASRNTMPDTTAPEALLHVTTFSKIMTILLAFETLNYFRISNEINHFKGLAENFETSLKELVLLVH